MIVPSLAGHIVRPAGDLMDTVRTTRTAALACIVGTTLAVLYVLAVLLTATEPPFGFVAQALIHLAELAGVLALAWSGAARGQLGRIGLTLAIGGQALLVVAEVTYPASPAVGETMFMIAPLLSSVGMVLAGAAVLRTGLWTGWHRFAALLVGVWSIVVLTPAIIASGGPPAPVALLAITGWDLTWLLLGLAALASTRVTTGERGARVV